MDNDISHSAHWRCEMRVKLKSKCKVDHWKFFTLFFIPLLILIFLLEFFNDISILPVDGRLHRSPSLEVQYLLDLILNILILLYLYQLFLHIKHVLKLELGLKLFELFIEHAG